MAVSILLITHNGIGSAMMDAATATFGELPLTTDIVSINYNSDPAILVPQIQEKIQKIDHGDGVLILTDMFGSTPSNISQTLQSTNRCLAIAGLNLSMLIRVMNYPDLNLNALAQKALSGGYDGVVNLS